MKTKYLSPMMKVVDVDLREMLLEGSNPYGPGNGEPDEEQEVKAEHSVHSWDEIW